MRATCVPAMLFIMLICATACAGAGEAFLKAKGTLLLLGGKPFRNVGVNMPDLFVHFLHNDDAGAEKMLADAEKAGVKFARHFGGTWGHQEFGLFETDRKRWLNAFDRMLVAADRRHIAVVPSLLFNANMAPEYVKAKTGREEGMAGLLTPGTESNKVAVEYVTTIVSRYKDDPRVLFWEIGNEYNLDADITYQHMPRSACKIPSSDQVRDFMVQIAALIHKIDHNHLVASGNSDMRPYAWYIRQAMLKHKNDPNPWDFPMDWTFDSYDQYVEMLRFFNPPPLDIVCVHQYRVDDPTAAWVGKTDMKSLMLPWARAACDEIGRPLYVGEFAQKAYVEGKEQPTEWTNDLFKQMREGMAPIASWWAWEFGSDDSVQDFYSMFPNRTPKLIKALTETNRAIAEDSGKSDRKSKEREVLMQAMLEPLHDLASEIVESAKLKPGMNEHSLNNTTPYVLRMPGGNAGYPAFWICDAAMMLGADFIGADEIEGWIKLISSVQPGPEGIKLMHGLIVPGGSIPDHITFAGKACWYPGAYDGEDQGNGTCGYLPPADDAFFFIQMVREHMRLTGKPDILNLSVNTGHGPVPVRVVCERAMNSVETDANGLVVCSAEEGKTRVDWGFCDAERKTGQCLFPSLLRWRAALDMAEMLKASGDVKGAESYSKEAGRIRAALVRTFVTSIGSGTALMLSATGLGKREDVWGSAYAVWLGILPSDIEKAVSRRLIELYRKGGTVLEGQVRHLPPDGPFGGFWEQGCARGMYQNGAFWGTPSGWYIAAMRKTNRALAERMLSEFLAHLQANRTKGAPWECINPEMKHWQNPLYCATVALPCAALMR